VALQRSYRLQELLIELSHSEHFTEYSALVSAAITAKVKALAEATPLDDGQRPSNA